MIEMNSSHKLLHSYELFEAGQYDLAFTHFSELSRSGVLEASFYLAWMLKEGKGAPRDFEKAKALFQQAVEYGRIESFNYLGSLYEADGDYQKALASYLIAADQGYAPAMYNLGRIYSENTGRSMDYSKARTYLTSASNKGHVFAMRKLGGLMIKGKFGFWLIPSGLAMLVKGALRLAYLSFKDPRSDGLRP